MVCAGWEVFDRIAIVIAAATSRVARGDGVWFDDTGSGDVYMTCDGAGATGGLPCERFGFTQKMAEMIRPMCR